MTQATDTEFRRVKVRGVREEAHRSPGIALAACIDNFQVRDLLTVSKADAMNLPIALDLYFQHLRQGVNHRYTYTVQAARVVVVVVIELTTGMQTCED